MQPNGPCPSLAARVLVGSYMPVFPSGLPCEVGVVLWNQW